MLEEHRVKVNKELCSRIQADLLSKQPHILQALRLTALKINSNKTVCFVCLPL